VNLCTARAPYVAEIVRGLPFLSPSNFFLLDRPRFPCRDVATGGGGNNTGTDAGPRLLLNPLITEVSEVKNGRMREGLY
jgi:hypothetical protein